MNPKQTWRFMRLTIILVIAGCLQVSALGYFQPDMFRLPDVPGKKMVQETAQLNSCSFLYPDSPLKKTRPADLDLAKTIIEEVLNSTIANQPLTCNIIGKMTIIKEMNVDVTSDGGESVVKAHVFIKQTFINSTNARAGKRKEKTNATKPVDSAVNKPAMRKYTDTAQTIYKNNKPAAGIKEDQHLSLTMILLLIGTDLLLFWQIIRDISNKSYRLWLIVFQIAASYDLGCFLIQESWNCAGPVIMQIIVLLLARYSEKVVNQKQGI